jgi:hypothetical protein
MLVRSRLAFQLPTGHPLLPGPPVCFNYVVHPPSSLTARPSHPGFRPALPLAALSGILADAPDGSDVTDVGGSCN